MEGGQRRLRRRAASMNHEWRRPADLLHAFDERKIDAELDKFDLDATNFGSFVLLKNIPNNDVFGASQVDDVNRLRFLLIDSGPINVNACSRWDTVTHYYDCLPNQFDDARMLLESGVICSDHTFDGDRCQYSVRKLLKAFKA
ncbi:hypothetical protein Ddye_005046 [Dipteronia dyeriana]|uniref:Uncharacterized protein n=1 Tax=Dipteronia dyeriana TaxID=168575 RepID=A0AAE0CPV8_9ROSI|nr:hypothetical protein Ddye_005046 [Dipteronia dyeriana]